MSITYISQHKTKSSSLAGMATAWKRLKQWFEVRQQRLVRQRIVDRLLELRQRDPQFYADLGVDFDPLPPSQSAVTLLPHAVIADFYVKERR